MSNKFEEDVRKHRHLFKEGPRLREKLRVIFAEPKEEALQKMMFAHHEEARLHMSFDEKQNTSPWRNLAEVICDHLQADQYKDLVRKVNGVNEFWRNMNRPESSKKTARRPLTKKTTLNLSLDRNASKHSGHQNKAGGELMDVPLEEQFSSDISLCDLGSALSTAGRRRRGLSFCNFSKQQSIRDKLLKDSVKQ